MEPTPEVRVAHISSHPFQIRTTLALARPVLPVLVEGYNIVASDFQAYDGQKV